MNEKPEWFVEHEKTERITFATKEDIKILMHEAMTEYFEEKGTVTKKILIATATIIGSLVVIGGGLKALLGWIGFTYMK